jgi:uncharacterized SAM-binding protein YcdF (DUF218 family)
MTAAARLLIEDDGPSRADAAVVLAGDGYGTRIIRGAQLAKAGYAPYVLVSDDFRYEHGSCNPSIEYAVEQGYPANLFRNFRTNADSTREEAASIDGYLKAHNVHSILLVTSNYHSRRAAGLMRAQDPALRVSAVAAPDPYFEPEGWWKTRNGQKTFLLEWMKTVATDLGD